MSSRSWPGVAVGALTALALPIVYSVVAVLLSSGIVPVTRTGLLFDLLNSLSLNALAACVLAILGVAIIASAARIRSGLAVVALYTLAIPLVAVLWFVSYATLGGALGSPF